MELENRSILYIAGFAGSRRRHRRRQVSLFTRTQNASRPLDAIVLELFEEPQTCDIHLN